MSPLVERARCCAGISVGWGWGASSYSRNNTVSRNRIDGVLSPVLKNLPGCLPPTFNRDGSPKPRQCLPLPNLADGGHIYTQEIQKSLIFGNHLTHDANRCKSSHAFSLGLSRCGLAEGASLDQTAASTTTEAGCGTTPTTVRAADSLSA